MGGSGGCWGGGSLVGAYGNMYFGGVGSEILSSGLRGLFRMLAGHSAECAGLPLGNRICSA